MLPLAYASILLFGFTDGLGVTPNSPCSSLCLGPGTISETHGIEIACNDDEYSQPKGERLEKCLDCLQTSGFGDDKEDDQSWFLRNLQFAVDWCLFSTDNTEVVGGPCLDDATCGGIQNQLAVANPVANFAGTFEYCSANGSQFEEEAALCNDCVQHMPNNRFLSNWIVALQTGCSQKPNRNRIIGLDDSVFSEDAIKASNTPSRKKNDGESTQLSVPAIVGIAVGGTAAIALLAAAIFFCRRRRRNRKRTSRVVDESSFGPSSVVSLYRPETGYDDKSDKVIESSAWDPDHIPMAKRQDTGNTVSTMSTVDTSPEPAAESINFSVPRSMSRSSSMRNQTDNVARNPNRGHIRNPLSMHDPRPSVDNTTESRPEHNAAMVSSQQDAHHLPADSTSIPDAQELQPPPQTTTSHHSSLQATPRSSLPPSPKPEPTKASQVLRPAKPQLSLPQQSQPKYAATSHAFNPVAPLPAYNPASYAPKNPPSYDMSQGRTITTTITLPRPNYFNAPALTVGLSNPPTKSHTSISNNPLSNGQSNFRPFSFVSPAQQARARPGSSTSTVSTARAIQKSQIPGPPCPIIAVPKPAQKKNKSVVLSPDEVNKAMNFPSAGSLPLWDQQQDAAESSRGRSAGPTLSLSTEGRHVSPEPRPGSRSSSRDGNFTAISPRLARGPGIPDSRSSFRDRSGSRNRWEIKEREDRELRETKRRERLTQKAAKLQSSTDRN